MSEVSSDRSSDVPVWRSGFCRWGKRLGIGYLVFCAIKGAAYLVFGATLWSYARTWWGGS